MDITVLIPNDEIREEDLQIGVRVRIQWDPNENKADVIGTIEQIRKWRREYRFPDEWECELIIRVKDESTGFSREASLGDQWVEIIAPLNCKD